MTEFSLSPCPFFVTCPLKSKIRGDNNQPLSLDSGFLFSPTQPFFVRKYEGPLAVIPLSNKMSQDGLMTCQFKLRASEEMREKYEASNKDTLQRTKKRKYGAVSDSQGVSSQVCLLIDGTEEEARIQDEDVSNHMKSLTEQGVGSPITSHANFQSAFPDCPKKKPKRKCPCPDCKSIAADELGRVRYTFTLHRINNLLSEAAGIGSIKKIGEIENRLAPFTKDEFELANGMLEEFDDETETHIRSANRKQGKCDVDHALPRMLLICHGIYFCFPCSHSANKVRGRVLQECPGENLRGVQTIIFPPTS